MGNPDKCICDDGTERIGGTCVPKCNDNEERQPDGSCKISDCPEGTHRLPGHGDTCFIKCPKNQIHDSKDPSICKCPKGMESQDAEGNCRTPCGPGQNRNSNGVCVSP